MFSIFTIYCACFALRSYDPRKLSDQNVGIGVYNCPMKDNTPVVGRDHYIAHHLKKKTYYSIIHEMKGYLAEVLRNNHVCSMIGRAGTLACRHGEGSGATMIQLFTTTKTTKGHVNYYYFLCNAHQSQSQQKAIALF